MGAWLAANWLALLALVVAALALIPSFKALNLARRQAELQNELHDVVWTMRRRYYQGQVCLEFTNSSLRSTAYSVDVTAHIEDEEQVGRVMQCGPRESVLVPFQWATQQAAWENRLLQEELENRRLLLRQAQRGEIVLRNGSVVTPPSGPVRLPSDIVEHVAKAHLSWVTGMGGPRSCDLLENRLMLFDYPD